MAIQATRYTLPESDTAFDAVLKTSLIEMLMVMLRDTELENRRLALTTLNSASHNKPDLIIPNLGDLLPMVMHASIIDQNLIHEMSIGPFKHKIDDGLELRKASSPPLLLLLNLS
jgi:cullin-associated NEDD8-dissociated protein 1